MSETASHVCTQIQYLVTQDKHTIVFLHQHTIATASYSPCHHVRLLKNNSLTGSIPNNLRSLTTLYVW